MTAEPDASRTMFNALARYEISEQPFFLLGSLCALAVIISSHPFETSFLVEVGMRDCYHMVCLMKVCRRRAEKILRLRSSEENHQAPHLPLALLPF